MEKILFKKTFFLSIIVIFIIGCASRYDTIDMPKSYQKIHQQNKTYSQSTPNTTGFYKPSTFIAKQNSITSTEKENSNNSLNFFGNGYIKGVVQKVYYSKTKHNWIYYIKGIDFTHNKLRYAKVYSSKKVAHLNDLVYAVIKEGFIASLYIYKTSKSYKVNKKIKFTNKSKQKRKILKKVKQSPKTWGRKQVISAPKVEKVTF